MGSTGKSILWYSIWLRFIFHVCKLIRGKFIKLLSQQRQKSNDGDSVNNNMYYISLSSAENLSGGIHLLSHNKKINESMNDVSNQCCSPISFYVYFVRGFRKTISTRVRLHLVFYYSYKSQKMNQIRAVSCIIAIFIACLINNFGVCQDGSFHCSTEFCVEKTRLAPCPDEVRNCTTTGFRTFLDPSECNCCSYCFDYLKEDDICSPSTNQKPVEMCGPFLTCIPSTSPTLPSVCKTSEMTLKLLEHFIRVTV